MKILIYSPSFYPNVGGIETIVATLATEFSQQGHLVKLVSLTPNRDAEQFTFEVIRQPKTRDLINLMRWCDVYFQGCISLKGIMPLLAIRKPYVASHHTWYRRANGSKSWQDYLKNLVSLFATNVSVSHAIASHLPVKSSVIPNSYRADTFKLIPEIKRDRELIFLGRLVSDKGVGLLLQALANLKEYGLYPKLTIIGKGAEENNLRRQARDLNILEQVNFVGVKTGRELVELLNAHQIMVVPSLWHEPFGIVALEGIACGCVVVGSEGGGLKDAIGQCGITFPNGNVSALTQRLAELLKDPSRLSLYRQDSEVHLSRHQQTEVAQAYLRVFEQAVG
ncbi:glycosyltransferase family 4 protein [Myxosarcina sp. GI1]|uniref:glycosyltransferase family 4 protein n=1 Tax=Myxosarcina sp. GI1 TaxID=1541065 RepID=UPI00055E8C8C|nr:glycosyltransferase family 4 protein [Myxosarcina sp. GI1]